MNSEILKIRKNKNVTDTIEREPERIDANKMNDIMHELNSNMATLYHMQLKDNIDIELFADKFAKNIYVVLDAFNQMGVYPDYFYDVILKMNTEYKKTVDNSNRLRGNYHLFDKTGLSYKVEESIKNGVEKGYYRANAYPSKDINDAILELCGFFQSFNIPHNIQTKEECKALFADIEKNVTNIMYRLYDSDDIVDDIEYLSRLLFEYLCFFAGMGIHPKEYLDNYINESENKKRK